MTWQHTCKTSTTPFLPYKDQRISHENELTGRAEPINVKTLYTDQRQFWQDSFGIDFDEGKTQCSRGADCLNLKLKQLRRLAL